MNLINETKAWFVDLYNKIDRQALWVRIAGGELSPATENALEQIITTITTTPTEIELPDAFEFIVMHETVGGVLYIGADSSVDDTYKRMLESDVMQIKGTNLSFWAVTDSGSIDVIAMAMIKE